MGTMTIQAADGGNFSAYMAKPNSGSGPALVVIQEIFGVNKVMRDLCDGYAAQGFVAICPDLFWRIEPGIDITDQTEAEWKQAFDLFGKFDVDKGVEDLKATIDAARAAGNGKVGSVGYCLGGKLAYLVAARTDADASVSFYGVGLEGLTGEAGAITNPLMLHIASEDGFVPKDAQAKINGDLEGHAHITRYTYDGQDHAFARIGGEHYDADAATLANQRTADFFQTHLGS